MADKDAIPLTSKRCKYAVVFTFCFVFFSLEAGINLLLCLSVYLLLVNSKMPSTSTAFPLLTKFYACAIIILVLAMCCTCLVYALYFMNSSGLEIHDAAMAIRLKVGTGRPQKCVAVRMFELREIVWEFRKMLLIGSSKPSQL